ncbi:hypothetical protein DXG01_012878 [Tephrocybe rancida]|nr:hypothetical protein DXG01_012878 [Tephrocybe rancida]
MVAIKTVQLKHGDVMVGQVPRGMKMVEREKIQTIIAPAHVFEDIQNVLSAPQNGGGGGVVGANDHEIVTTFSTGPRMRVGSRVAQIQEGRRVAKRVQRAGKRMILIEEWLETTTLVASSDTVAEMLPAAARA